VTVIVAVPLATPVIVNVLPVIEALATLGYVNAFGRGVIRAQDALRRNGHPEARFTFDPSHVLATIRRAA